MIQTLTLPHSLHDREERLALARIELKAKYVGIDEQIDTVIDRLTYWYLRPDKPRRPVIINLWGTTGVGKTDLIRDIKSILGFNDAYTEVMLSDNEGVHEIVDSITDSSPELSKGAQGILVLDEFQRYRTKEQNGEPRRGMGYKDLWQILSDGIVIKNMSRFDFIQVFNKFGWFPATGYGKYDHEGDPVEDSEMEEKRARGAVSVMKWGSANVFSESFKFRDPDGVLYLSPYVLRDPHSIVELRQDLNDYARLLKSRNIDHDGTVEGILEGLSSLIQPGMPDNLTTSHDFRKIAIFVIGNLDDVYTGALRSDSPFIPADYYRTWSKSITIYDVKDSLFKLFFPEQVSRLGNTHVIYPTLGEAHYRELISRGMRDIINDINEDGFPIIIDDSLIEFVYRNSVYPTQGVRPVFSSIQDTANTVLTAFQGMKSPGPAGVTVSYNPQTRTVNINTAGGLVAESPITGDRDRVMDKITSSSDALKHYSVHELGHALVHYVTMGRVPLFCVITETGARTVDVHHLSKTFDVSWANVVMAMGGAAAVEVVYGKKHVSGHTADLSMATRSITDMIRSHGFGDALEERVSGSWWKKLKNFFSGSGSRPISCRYTVVGDKTAEDGEVILSSNVDHNLVDKALRAAHLQSCGIIRQYPEVVLELAGKLSQELFLSGDEIIKVFEQNNIPKGNPVTFEEQAEE